MPLENDVNAGIGKILVIDDDPALVKLVDEMLEIMGYNTVSSISGEEGLHIFKESPEEFALVITDMTMPKITGDIVARKINTIRSNIPIILCTGFNENISEAQAKEIGICEIIMKPVNMKTLSGVIQRLIGKNQPNII